VVDVFDANTGQWFTTTLSQERDTLAATSVGPHALFGGGSTTGFAPSNVVDIFSVPEPSSVAATVLLAFAATRRSRTDDKVTR
jgi:hypothetical protein